MRIIQEIDELVEKGLWQTALLKLYDELKKRSSKEILIRLLFVGWYSLIEWHAGLCFAEEADEELFKRILAEATSFAIQKYKNDAEVNFYLGYMVSLSFWFFSDEIKGEEEEAEKMLEFAKNCDTNNPVYKMVYLASSCCGKRKFFDPICAKSS